MLENNMVNRQTILIRLLLLRIVFLAAALGVLLYFQWYLQRSLLYTLLYGVLIVGYGYSLHTWWGLRRRKPVTDLVLLLQVLLDAAMVLVLVAFSGRAANPFIYYLLVLIAIGATLFPYRVSWLLALFSVAAYTLLLYMDLDMHIVESGVHQHRGYSDFQLHLVGMWVNFVGSALLLNLFVSKLSTALRDREIALARAREQTLKHEHLVGIGTLAASTVHALGTPLSTMAVIVGELQNSEDDDSIALLKAQIERCKYTMENLSKLAEPGNDDSAIRVIERVNGLRDHYLLLNPAIMPMFTVLDVLDQVSITGSMLLQYALTNLIDNAVRAARSLVRVEVALESATNRVVFSIIDDGPGLAPELIDSFGQPMSAKHRGGLGIGIFLANSTIEQLHGEIVLYNPDESGCGNTMVVVKLPVGGEKE